MSTFGGDISPQDAQDNHDIANNVAATEAASRQVSLLNQAIAQRGQGNLTGPGGYYDLTGQALQALADYYRAVGSSYSAPTYQGYVDLANDYDKSGACYRAQAASGIPSC